MVYLVLDGILRYIPNPTVAIRLFGEQWGDGVRNELDLVTITTGSSLPLDTRIVRFGEMPELYLCFTELNATRSIIRPILNATIIKAYSFYGSVLTLPANSEHNYDRHAPLQSPDAILKRPDLNGKRIHDANTGMVYLIIDGVLRYIPNPETANSIFGSNWGVDGDIFPNVIEKSTPLPQDARIIKFRSGPKLYLSFKEPGESKTTIRHIPNMRVLGEYGLHGKIHTSDREINEFSEKLPLPPASSLDPQ
jgi:hypothetical protein